MHHDYVSDNVLDGGVVMADRTPARLLTICLIEATDTRQNRDPHAKQAFATPFVPRSSHLRILLKEWEKEKWSLAVTTGRGKKRERILRHGLLDTMTCFSCIMFYGRFI